VNPHEPFFDERLATVLDLGREAVAVLDLPGLLRRIPELMGRLVPFDGLAIYLRDGQQDELSLAYAHGYPSAPPTARRSATGRVPAGEAGGEAPGAHAGDSSPDAVQTPTGLLALPLVANGQTIGALDLVRATGAFTAEDEGLVTRFAAVLAVAIENARVFQRARQHTVMLETLTEIAREVASILNLEELLSRIAVLTRRIIEYRTFGIFLVNEETGYLEPKVGFEYGDRSAWPRIKLGEGLVGYAAQHKQVVLVDDVTKDARYLNVIGDVRSELVIPLLLKDRCVGVFDLESPELKAFTRDHAELLGILASQAAVAIENARLYQEIRQNEVRLEREMELARRVQEALLSPELPRRLRGVDVAGRSAPAREVGGDLYNILLPEPSTLVLAVGDVSGKGLPAALYGAYASELVRSRTKGSRYAESRSSPASVLTSINTVLRQRPLEPYYCALCYALFDLKRRRLTIANSGLPYPIRYHNGRATQIEVAGVPLGSFAGSAYEEVTLDLIAGDLYVFCTDGVTEANDVQEREFGPGRLQRLLHRCAQSPAQAIVDKIFEAVEAFRGTAAPSDDMTAVAVRITA
jgi:phosphoserine phosphatase RsbU/P